MTGYLINFAVYTMAMIGALLLCFIIYKKTLITPKITKNTNNLEVENTLNLSPRKTLYVIKAGDEKFLIAADAERTSFLARLDEPIEEQPNMQEIVVEKITTPKTRLEKVTDYSEIMSSIETKNKKPIMREIMRKLDIPQ